MNDKCDLDFLVNESDANSKVMEYAVGKYSLERTNLGILYNDELLSLFNGSNINYNSAKNGKALELTQGTASFLCWCKENPGVGTYVDFNTLVFYVTQF